MRAGLHRYDHGRHIVKVPFVEICGEGSGPKATRVEQYPSNDGVLQIRCNGPVLVSNMVLYKCVMFWLRRLFAFRFGSREDRELIGETEGSAERDGLDSKGRMRRRKGNTKQNKKQKTKKHEASFPSLPSNSFAGASAAT